MPNIHPFYNLHTHGFLRVAVATPEVALANPHANADGMLTLLRKAHNHHVSLVVFPELCLSSYTLDDLVFQDAVLDDCENALARLLDESHTLSPVFIVGMPLRVQSSLYNVALIIHAGVLLGVVPKTYVPNYREFYEQRHFTSGALLAIENIRLCDQSVPFGTNLIFCAHNMRDFTFGVEICEDGWVPIPPSAHLAMSGAHIIANPSASNVTVGKSDYRHALCRVRSTSAFCAYLYTAAGAGESTTDLAWDGHAMIYENGNLMAESVRFSQTPQLTMADIDLDQLRQERMRHNTFASCARNERNYSARYINFNFYFNNLKNISLIRRLKRFPYIFDELEKLDQLCFETYNIQVAGLIKRLRATGITKVVIGISGGLDSTQALLCAIKAFDELEFSRKNILAYTLPAFATSKTTRQAAWDLMTALGVSASEIDMTPACGQMLKDIEHPNTKGSQLFDITYENVQAGARTSTLFRLANFHNALVLGTGDLSELALGWCTYGVGDHMSHYNVNASVPKTLIQHLIRWVVNSKALSEPASSVLSRILDTEISPELIPKGQNTANTPTQRTEDYIGPYELQDFTLYHITRFSAKPSKIAFLAMHAWGNRDVGSWPPHIAETAKNDYSLREIKKWLNIFLWRFFQTSQFKRSALPNGPKVASGGSLSPRGDWRAPSDSSAKIWIDELNSHVPES